MVPAKIVGLTALLFLAGFMAGAVHASENAESTPSSMFSAVNTFFSRITGHSIAGSACGNGVCDADESYMTCSDCQKPAEYYSLCGNNVCESGESYLTCSDCPKPMEYYTFCGNDICESGESYLTCSDCPKPVVYYSFCGNGICDSGESYLTCSDCPKPVDYYASCGNNVCDSGESYLTCSDCPKPVESYSISCTDSDGGINYYVKGETTGTLDKDTVWSWVGQPRHTVNQNRLLLFCSVS